MFCVKKNNQNYTTSHLTIKGKPFHKISIVHFNRYGTILVSFSTENQSQNAQIGRKIGKYKTKPKELVTLKDNLM